MKRKKRYGIIILTFLLVFILPHNARADGFGIRNAVLVDDLVLYGDAKIIEDEVTELTDCDTWEKGSAWYRKRVHASEGFTVEFDYWAGGGRDKNLGGADGILLQFSSTTGIGGSGQDIGFKADSYGVELDSYENSGEGIDPDGSGKHIGIIGKKISNHLKLVSDDRVDDSSWHTLTVAYKDNTLEVSLDGESVTSADDIDLPDWIYIGVSASTGVGVNRHLIKNFTIDGMVLESSTFILGRDNNSFCHYASSSEYSGFYGIKNHNLDLDYIKALAKDSSADLGAIASLCLNSYWPGDGWCFGIASTMGLVHDNQVAVSTISSDSAKNYFEMSPPYLNKNLKNAINYYFVAQNYISSETGLHTTIPEGMINGKSIYVNKAAMDYHDFLKGLVHAAEDNDLVFCYPGHAVLITDSIKNNDDTFTLIVFDENSVTVNNPYGSFGTIDIDLVSFKMTYIDYNGNTVLSSEESENAQLYYVSTSQLASVTKAGIKTAKNKSLIKIPRNRPVRVVDKNGKAMLQSTDGKIVAEVPVYDFKMLVCNMADEYQYNTTEYVQLEVDEVEGITVINDGYDKVEVELTNSDNTVRFVGEFDEITLDTEEGIKTDGTVYDFVAGISSKDKSQSGIKQVLVVDGYQAKDFEISKTDDNCPFVISGYDEYGECDAEFFDGEKYISLTNIDLDADNFIDESGKVKTSEHIVKYSVTFEDGFGKTLKTEEVENGKAAKAPSNPKKDGYTFKGWDTDFSNITKDITVTALWEKNTDPSPSITPTTTPNPAVVKDKVTTFSIKNKAKIKKTAKIKVKDKDKIKKITLNGKKVKIKKNKASVTIKLKSYKKALKKKGKWNKLVVTDAKGNKKTIKFKIK